MKHSLFFKTTIHKLLVSILILMPVALHAQDDDQYMYSSSEDLSYYGQLFYQYGYRDYLAGDEKEATNWFRRAYYDFKMDISLHPQNGFSYYHTFLIGYIGLYKIDNIIQMADSALKYLPIEEFNARNQVEYLVCEYLYQQNDTNRATDSAMAFINKYSPNNIDYPDDSVIQLQCIERFKNILYKQAVFSYDNKPARALKYLNRIVNTNPVTNVDSMALLFLSKIYYNYAWDEYYSGNAYAIDNDLDTLPKEYMDKFDDYLNKSIMYHEKAQVNMNETSNIEDLYIAISYYYTREQSPWYKKIDTSRANEAYRATARFFTKNPHKLFEGNAAYAYITMKSLLDNCDYITALDFYDTVSTRFHADIELQSYRAQALIELGYYGKDYLVIFHQFHNGSHGTFLDSTDRESFNLYMYYWRGKYHEAIYYCDSALRERNYRDTSINRKGKSDILIIRGASYDFLSQQTSSGEKRNYYFEKANADYNESIEIKKANGERIDPFVLARLGRYKEAIKHALDGCHQADSLIAHKYQTDEDDSLNAFQEYLLLSQIYCMSGHITKAKRSIRKALSYDHSSVALSMVICYPFLSPIKQEIDKLVQWYVKESPQELKVFENDTTITILKYISSNNAISVRCFINGHLDTLQYDPGASYVQITRSMADKLRRDGTLTDDDSLGSMRFYFANDDSAIQPIVRLRSLKVGEIELHDVVATISESTSGLLGQSFNSNFEVIVNHDDQLLTFKRIKYKR